MVLTSIKHTSQQRRRVASFSENAFDVRTIVSRKWSGEISSKTRKRASAELSLFALMFRYLRHELCARLSNMSFPPSSPMLFKRSVSESNDSFVASDFATAEAPSEDMLFPERSRLDSTDVGGESSFSAIAVAPSEETLLWLRSR